MGNTYRKVNLEELNSDSFPKPSYRRPNKFASKDTREDIQGEITDMVHEAQEQDIPAETPRPEVTLYDVQRSVIAVNTRLFTLVKMMERISNAVDAQSAANKALGEKLILLTNQADALSEKMELNKTIVVNTASNLKEDLTKILSENSDRTLKNILQELDLMCKGIGATVGSLEKTLTEKPKKGVFSKIKQFFVERRERKIENLKRKISELENAPRF